MARPDRDGGGGLSLRTLAIASAASLTAAMLTARLFPPGTVYTAALTPIIVAAVSEMLNRPADRVSELRRQRRTMVLEAQEVETARVLGEETSPLAGAPEFAQGSAADELHGNGSGDHAPMRVHRSRRSRALHPKVWIATGLAAFAIAVAVLTLPELLFGGSVSNSHRTTIFGGSDSSSKSETKSTPAETQTQTTVTETVPATTPTETTPTQTEPTTTDTGTSTTPSGGTAPPGDTSTETSTTPAGAVPPTP